MQMIRKYILENWLWISIGSVATEKALVYAYVERDCFRIGSEWMIIPVCLAISAVINDFKRRRG